METTQTETLALEIKILERGKTYRKGIMKINDVAVMHTIEPTDTYLYKTSPLSEILQRKQLGKIAIPYGTYNVSQVYSEKFKMVVLLLSGVPGFQGIEIHCGNSSVDSEGCILVGISERMNEDWIGYSRSGLKMLMEIVKLHSYKQILLTIKP